MLNPSPATIREACRDTFHAEALEQLVEKASPREVIDGLMARGLSREEAESVTNTSANLMRNAGQSVGAAHIAAGTVSVALGLGVTLLTFLLAMDSGGICILWYGAVVGGFLSISKGFQLRRSNTRGYLRDLIHEAIRAASAFHIPKADSEEPPADGQKPLEEARSRRLYDY